MMMLIMGVAPILAPLFGGLLVTVIGWRSLFWVLAIYGAVCGIAIFLRLKESLPPAVRAHARTESPLRAYLSLLRIPRLVGYLLFGAANSAAVLTYVSASAGVLIGTFHVPPQAFGWLFGVNSLGFIAGSQINRRLLRRYSYDRLLVWANLTGIVSSSLLAAAALTGFGGIYGVMIPLFLLISGAGFNSANTLAGIMAIDPRRAGATAALIGSAQFAAGAAASAVAGALHDGTARPMALVIFAMMAVAGAALHTLAKPARGVSPGAGP
jgi:DHA1 family bicyclomycin/chloramphenicol resistance-like MFS transporter